MSKKNKRCTTKYETIFMNIDNMKYNTWYEVVYRYRNIPYIRHIKKYNSDLVTFQICTKESNRYRNVWRGETFEIIVGINNS